MNICVEIWYDVAHIFTFLKERLSSTKLIAFIQVFQTGLYFQTSMFQIQWVELMFIVFFPSRNTVKWLAFLCLLLLIIEKKTTCTSDYNQIYLGPHATNYNIWFSLWPIWHATFFVVVTNGFFSLLILF